MDKLKKIRERLLQEVLDSQEELLDLQDAMRGSSKTFLVLHKRVQCLAKLGLANNILKEFFDDG